MMIGLMQNKTAEALSAENEVKEFDDENLDVEKTELEDKITDITDGAEKIIDDVK